MKSKLFVGAIVLILIALWMMRYGIIPVANGAYKIDRFTGSITFCQAEKQYEVSEPRIVYGSERLKRPHISAEEFLFQRR